MGAPVTPPCEPWIDETDLCSPCNDYDFNTVLMSAYMQTASELLYAASGRQYPGPCEETIRPCSARRFSDFAGFYLSPDWRRACSCSTADDCGCSYLPKIGLGATPVTDVSQVKVDGTVLSPSLYRVDDYQYLVRLPDPDGTNPGWPCCQDLSLPDTADDTFSVTFTYGLEVPAAGRLAAGVLACELYMACNPEDFAGKCRLPKNTVTVTRQGTTVNVEKMSDLLAPPVRTGIFEIDVFLATSNPYGLTSPCIVLSPDLPMEGTRIDT